MTEKLGCPSRKIVYGTRPEAFKALKASHWGANRKQVYKCPHCGYWHHGKHGRK